MDALAADSSVRRTAECEAILRPPFEHQGGLLWKAQLPPGFGGPSDSPDTPAASCLRLFENGVPLGPRHASHAEIGRNGQGLYSHWGGVLWFSTRDGSNPNVNGFRYTVSVGEPTLKLAGFGSCHLSAALNDLHVRGLAYSLWSDPSPTVSPREALQLIDFRLGRLDIPEPQRSLVVSAEPEANNLATVIGAADVVFLEFGTLIDAAYGPFWIPRANIGVDLLERFAQIGRTEGRIAKRWYHLGLVRQNETTRRELACQLLQRLPSTRLNAPLVRDVIDRARGDLQPGCAAARTIGCIREALGAAVVCVVSANNAYMPDGRPVSWPRNFAKELEPICRQLNLPLLHSHRLVAERGVEFSLVPETPLHHFTPQFLTVLGEEMLAMGRRALGRAASPA